MQFDCVLSTRIIFWFSFFILRVNDAVLKKSEGKRSVPSKKELRLRVVLGEGMVNTAWGENGASEGVAAAKLND